jgi:hypothetical protein
MMMWNMTACQYFHSISLSLFYNVSSPVLVHSLLSSTPTYSLVVVVVSLSFSQEQLFLRQDQIPIPI